MMKHVALALTPLLFPVAILATCVGLFFLYGQDFSWSPFTERLLWMIVLQAIYGVLLVIRIPRFRLLAVSILVLSFPLSAYWWMIGALLLAGK